MDLHSGSVVEGRYVVERPLGEGGMARVWRVRHARLGTPLALKVLHVTAPSLRQRLLLEGKVQGGLRHPHVVAVTDVVDIGGCPGLVMELVDGPPLSRLLEATRLTVQQVDQLGRGILEGVAAAHTAGLVHRDLKPANVLLAVGPGGVVPKVTDFGLAKVLAADSPSTTRSGATLGSPAYMSPEQIRDAKNVDARSDVFSLGVLLYEMATGQHPFASEDLLALFERIAQGGFTPLQELVPELPHRMVRAIEGALRVDPAERLPDARAVLEVWTEGASSGGEAWPVQELEIARSLGSVHPEASETFPPVEVDPGPALPTVPPDASVLVPEPAPPRSPGRRALFGAVLLLCFVGGAVGVAALRTEPAPVLFSASGAPSLADPGADAAMQQAWARLLRAEPQVASREAERVVAAHPSAAEPRLLLYLALRLQQRLGSAEQVLHDPAFIADGDGPAAVLLTALREDRAAALDWRRRHRDDLLGALLVRDADEPLVERHPELPVAWLDEAHQRMFEGDLDGADQALRQASSLSLGATWVAYERARLEIARGDLEQARQALVAVLREDPGLVLARSRLAVVLRILGREEEAARYAATLRDETVPADQQVVFANDYAQTLIGLGAFGEARELLAWGIDVADEARLTSDLARLVLLEFTLEDLTGAYPPRPEAFDRLRRLAAAPDLPEPVRKHLQTGLLAVEAEAAVSAGSLDRAEADLERLERLGGPFAPRVAMALAVVRGELESLPEPGACLQDWLLARLALHHGHEDAALQRLRSVLAPETCRDEGLDQACVGMAATELAAIAARRGERAEAEAAVARAREVWPAMDPTHAAAARVAAVEATLAEAPLP